MGVVVGKKWKTLAQFRIAAEEEAKEVVVFLYGDFGGSHQKPCRPFSLDADAPFLSSVCRRGELGSLHERILRGSRTGAEAARGGNIMGSKSSF